MLVEPTVLDRQIEAFQRLARKCEKAAREFKFKFKSQQQVKLKSWLNFNLARRDSNGGTSLSSLEKLQSWPAKFEPFEDEAEREKPRRSNRSPS